jgi:hypothetical protein
MAAALLLAGCAAQNAYREGQTLLAEDKVDAGLAKIQEAMPSTRFRRVSHRLHTRPGPLPQCQPRQG